MALVSRGNGINRTCFLSFCFAKCSLTLCYCSCSWFDYVSLLELVTQLKENANFLIQVSNGNKITYYVSLLELVTEVKENANFLIQVSNGNKIITYTKIFHKTSSMYSLLLYHCTTSRCKITSLFKWIRF